MARMRQILIVAFKEEGRDHDLLQVFVFCQIQYTGCSPAKGGGPGHQDWFFTVLVGGGEADGQD